MDGELLGPDVRVALLGAEDSGKTCLSHTLVGKDYQDTPPTEGVDHMEIVVESTTNWQPLTDEQKLDDLEKQKYLEAMHMSATRPRQPASVTTSSYMPSTLSAATNPSTQAPLHHIDSSSIQLPSSSNTKRPHPPSQGSYMSKQTSPKSKKQKRFSSRLSHDEKTLLSIEKFKSLKAIRERYNPYKKYINIWDFAGQAVFQHTHGTFVSENVVCLILFEASL